MTDFLELVAWIGMTGSTIGLGLHVLLYFGASMLPPGVEKYYTVLSAAGQTVVALVAIPAYLNGVLLSAILLAMLR